MTRLVRSFAPPLDRWGKPVAIGQVRIDGKRVRYLKIVAGDWHRWRMRNLESGRTTWMDGAAVRAMPLRTLDTLLANGGQS